MLMNTLRARAFEVETVDGVRRENMLGLRSVRVVDNGQRGISVINFTDSQREIVQYEVRFDGAPDQIVLDFIMSIAI